MNFIINKSSIHWRSTHLHYRASSTHWRASQPHWRAIASRAPSNKQPQSFRKRCNRAQVAGLVSTGTIDLVSGTNLYDSTAQDVIAGYQYRLCMTTHDSIGRKRYELSNHLGNVLVAISDRKVQVDAGSDGVYDYFLPDVWVTNDYLPAVASAKAGYPFGMLQPGRNFSSEGYRFGFNGQEKDDEVNGTGNSYTAQYWQYDPRLGRRWNVDPEFRKIPSLSSYQVFSNNPIFYIDPYGNIQTDYFNKFGKKIGSDGDNNGKKVVVFNEKAKNEIKEATNNNEFWTNESSYSEGLIDFSDPIIDQIEKTFDKMETDNDHEEGFWGGMKDGKHKFEECDPGPKGVNSYNEYTLTTQMDEAFLKYVKANVSLPSYWVHGHPRGLGPPKKSNNSKPSGASASVKFGPTSDWGYQEKAERGNNVSYAMVLGYKGSIQYGEDNRARNVTVYNSKEIIGDISWTVLRSIRSQ